MQFNVHEAKSNLSQLLDLVAQGQEVILARNGNPVAKLVALDPPKSLLGAGVGDPNFIGGAPTDAVVRSARSGGSEALGRRLDCSCLIPMSLSGPLIRRVASLRRPAVR